MQTQDSLFHDINVPVNPITILKKIILQPLQKYKMKKKDEAHP